MNIAISPRSSLLDTFIFAQELSDYNVPHIKNLPVFSDWKLKDVKQGQNLEPLKEKNRKYDYIM